MKVVKCFVALDIQAKKAFFIPTPGQYEQEYLAKKFKKEGLVPYSKQDKFKLKKLKEIDVYPGLPKINSTINWPELFKVFDIPVKNKAF